MNLSRAAFLPLLALPLVGCGSNVIPSSGEAHDIACRGYVLTVGNDDRAHVADLISTAQDQGNDVTTDAALGKIRGAAATAGSSPGLSDRDYALFRAVVERIDAVAGSQKVLDDGTTMSTSVTSLTSLSKAVAAVHKLCY